MYLSIRLPIESVSHTIYYKGNLSHAHVQTEGPAMFPFLRKTLQSEPRRRAHAPVNWSLLYLLEGVHAFFSSRKHIRCDDFESSTAPEGQTEPR